MWDGHRVRDWTNPNPRPPEASYTFVDVFAGIGGFRFGFEPRGGHCVWSCEIDAGARRTYSANHDTPEAEIFRDVREAGPKDVPDHDALIAGFPCPVFSTAGVSKLSSLGRPTGFADKARGTLFFEIVRLLAEHRPQYFLLENVPGLLTHDRGRTMATVKSLLEDELGYRTDHRILDSDGYVPQRRRRVFIAGRQGERPSLGKIRQDPGGSQTLAEILHPQDGTEDPETPYTNGPQASVGQRYTLGDGTWSALQRHRDNHRQRGNGFGYTVADLGQPSRTLTARYGKDGQEILIDQPGRNPRRLTPRECARLMGMPELIIPVSDTQAYRQLGNSVVPPLVEEIAAALTH